MFYVIKYLSHICSFCKPFYTFNQQLSLIMAAAGSHSKSSMKKDDTMIIYKRPYDNISDITRYLKYIGTSVEVWGWVIETRHQSEQSFIKIIDGTSFKPLQCVIIWRDHEETKRETWEQIKRMSSVVIRGVIIECPEELQKFQRVELHVSEIDIHGLSDTDLHPIKKKVSMQQIRQYPELSFRTRLRYASMKIRHCASIATSMFYDQHDYWLMHTPLLTSSDCEGAGEIVRATTLMHKSISDIPTLEDKTTIDYSQDLYGDETYLSVSGQLHVEGACLAYQRTYTFGPFFRHEGSCTRKHLGEGWMVEPEHIVKEEEGLKCTIDLAESYIKFMIDYILKRCKDEIEFCGGKFLTPQHGEYLSKVLKTPFIRIKYVDGIELLLDAQSKGTHFVREVSMGIDMDASHEKWLVKYFDDIPVVITHFPADIKAFYMKPSPEDPSFVESFDILVKDIGEIVGGSVREHRLESLMKIIDERDMDTKPLEYYLRLRRFGTSPHAGFGLGFDRMIMMLTGFIGCDSDSGITKPDIRETIPYPRQSGSIIC